MKVKTFIFIAMLILMSVYSISAHGETWENHGILHYEIYNAEKIL